MPPFQLKKTIYEINRKRYIRVLIRSNEHSLAMCNSATPAQVLIHVAPGLSISAFPLDHQDRVGSLNIGFAYILAAKE